jgi:hypothetical protein
MTCCLLGHPLLPHQANRPVQLHRHCHRGQVRGEAKKGQGEGGGGQVELSTRRSKRWPKFTFMESRGPQVNELCDIQKITRT